MSDRSSGNNAPNAEKLIKENAQSILALEGHGVEFSEGKTLRGESALVMTFQSTESYDAYITALQEKGIILAAIREPIGNDVYCIKLNTAQCVDVIQTNQYNIEAEQKQQYETAFNPKQTPNKNPKGTKKITNFIVNSTNRIIGNVVDLKKGKPFKAIKKYVREDLESPRSKLKRFAMPMILPSLSMEKPPEPPANLGIDKVNVKVNLHKKDVLLNTYQYEPEALKAVAVADKKYVVHFNGNAQFAADKIEESVQESKNLNCVAIAFDYPGIGTKEDKAKNTKDLVKAGVAQVESLIKAGAKPENIVLDGHSLGGAVATLVAAELHKKGQPVHLINGRSFSKLSTETDLLLNKQAGLLAGQVNSDGTVKENSKIKALGPLLGKLAKVGIKAAGLEMNAAKAYKSIPDEYKTCYFAQKDEIIPFKASLAKAVGVKKDDDFIAFSSGKNTGDHNSSAREIFNTEFKNADEFRTEFIKKAFKVEDKKLVKDNSDDLDLIFKPKTSDLAVKKTVERDPVDTPHTFLPLNHQLETAIHDKKKAEPESTDTPTRRKSTKPGE